MGAIFFAVAFIDMIVEENKEVFIYNLLIRATVFVVAVGIALFILRGKGVKTVFIAIMFFLIFFVCGYQSILFLYNGQGFTQQGMVYLLIIYGIFLMPNRWIYTICFNVGIVALFFLITPLYIEDISFSQFLSVLVCLVSAIVLGSINSYNLNRHRRLQFFREQQLDILSNSDYLTGIYNRQKFDEIFTELFKVHENRKINFSIVMFDLDDFKYLNDTYGHALGDVALRACVNEVRKGIRKNEVLCRWGGEEFMLLLPRATRQEACLLAERLRQRIENLVLADGIRITASFGVTDCHEGDTTDTVLSRVDACLYDAKQKGKNCVSTETLT